MRFLNARKLTLLMVAIAMQGIGLIATEARADVGLAEYKPGGDSLTTGVLTVANSAYGEFYAPAGRIEIRALNDNVTTATLAFVRYFATDPGSSDLDASTREKTGVALQEGDTLVIVLDRPGWIAIDGATGTSQIVARVIK